MSPRLARRATALAVLATTSLTFAGAAQGATPLLPFPNDSYTKKDKSKPTGLRLNFKASQMPRNSKGVAIDPRPFLAFDGFSPGSVILAKVPGLDNDKALARTQAVSLSNIGAYSAKDAPVLLIDASTGKRHPIWVEVDSNPNKAKDRLLEIHPAKNLAEGHRYVVVLRNLKRSNGKPIKADRAFARVRDASVTAQRYTRIFKTLKKAKVKRDRSLFLTWDFTVASEQSLAGRMLHIRDDAFAQLGDTNLGDSTIQGRAPEFTMADKPLTGDDAKYADGRWARVVEGEITVPCYMDLAGCGTGSKFNFGADGQPAQLPGNVARAHYTCVVPATATPDNPARLVLYGHGLLGSDREALTNPDMPKMAAEGNIVFCATPWAGMSREDIPNAITVLGDFSRMPTIADRLQQGMLNALYLGRAMAHPAGLATNPLLQTDGRPIVKTGALFYDGNSQGGISGGALTAVAPDYTHAALGVPGMNYSVLLPRSVDFDTYAAVFDPAYPNELERPLILDLAQIQWDRGEADGYAHHMTDDPLPNTPKHTVLMHVAFGDHQVTPFQADVEARTIGARIHQPVLAAGRSPQKVASWGIPAISSYPFGGSAIVYWDPGASVVPRVPLHNQPPREGSDPHEHPRRTPAARQQKIQFLQPGGQLFDVCGGAPCLSAPDVG
jgi:hypothetical protein